LHNLIVARKYGEATALCTAWLDSSDTVKKAEAHKCLSNAVLSDKDNEVVILERDGLGGVAVRDGFYDWAVGETLKHPGGALRLAPQDISIQQ
jgi:hypothetical protein